MTNETLSANARRRRGTILVQLRRCSQAFFLLLFFFLLFATSAEDFQSFNVNFFLQLDPLVALTALLAAREIQPEMLLGLLTVAATIVFGRLFCGWICPLGTLHHIIGRIGQFGRKANAKASLRRAPAKPKYFILFFLLAASALGAQQAGLLDPIAFITRSTTGALIPLFDPPATHEGVQLGVPGAWFLAVIFLLTLGMNFIVPRFWCRTICPLGALLGLLGRKPLVGIVRSQSLCSDCGLCNVHCNGAAEPDGKLKTAECLFCLNCRSKCPTAAIEIRTFPGSSQNGGTSAVDLQRRSALAAIVSGVLTAWVMRLSPQRFLNRNPYLIRPPGSLPEPEFLSLCLKCGQCTQVCPTRAIQPALAEAGIEGLWSPVMNMRIGYCLIDCTRCGAVCPTGAIRSLTLGDRQGKPPEKKPISIGCAFINRGICLPWGMDIPCIVCEEVCPTPTKAIVLKKTTKSDPSGVEIEIKLPFVIPELCIGCGVCENRCPVRNPSAIIIGRAGESRDSTARFIL